MARLVAEFEEDQADGGPGAKRNIEGLHHEHQLGVQSAFLQSVTGTVRNVETISQEQYSKFVYQRLSKCVTPVSDPLPKNNLPLFSRPVVKAPSKGKLSCSQWRVTAIYSRGYIWLVRQEMVMWISSSLTKIMLAHHLCHREENCGLAQRQI